MRLVQVLNTTRGTVVGARVELADGWWRRLRGLYGRPPLVPGEGLLCLPCTRVHARGTRRPLDVALLAPDGEVITLYPFLQPGGWTARHSRVRCALLLPAGMLRGSRTVQGDHLAWSEWAVGLDRIAAATHRPVQARRLAYGTGRALVGEAG